MELRKQGLVAIPETLVLHQWKTTSTVTERHLQPDIEYRG